MGVIRNIMGWVSPEFGPEIFWKWRQRCHAPPPTNSFLRSEFDEKAAVAILVGLAALINFTVMISSIGEQDTARILNDVLIWEKSGTFYGGEYRPKVLPLYILIIKGLYAAGFHIDSVIALLTGINAFLGALIIIPLFMIWRRLLSADIAFYSCIALSFFPSFWVSHLYAFPHMPALFFLVTSLAVSFAANNTQGGRGVILHVVAFALAMVAGGLKADLVLMSGVFPAALLMAKRIEVRNIVFAILIPIGVIASPLLLKEFLITVQDSSSLNSIDTVESWSQRFPLVADAFFSFDNVVVMATSAGPIFILLMLVGGVRLLTYDRLRTVAIFVAVLALPAIFFWGFRWGNSSRHLMASFVGWRRWWRLRFLASCVWNVPALRR